ncbi:hypothetical protein [Candidatus Lokiarchaeum ossiferum]|uniref:hypothetical protein n=1 Tax=Candidatus Lokiarchaeum ossiferum TaxID=2951803 RepID=UPI00352F4D07
MLEEAWNLIYSRNFLFIVGLESDFDLSAIYTINITDPIHATETDDLESIKDQHKDVGNFDVSATKLCLSNMEKRLKILSLLPTSTVVIIVGISIVSVVALSVIVILDRRKNRIEIVLFFLLILDSSKEQFLPFRNPKKKL